MWNVLRPRNPLLRITVAPDPHDNIAVVALFALGCFEAGDDLYIHHGLSAFQFLLQVGGMGERLDLPYPQYTRRSY
jgi:hypothetical protein